LDQPATFAREGPDPFPRSPLSPVDEAKLISDVLLGDRKAIADFVFYYSDSVFSFLHRRLDNRTIVEDLCQEVFLVAWSKLNSFEGRSSLKTWLHAIAQHKVADFYRKQIRELPLEDDWEEQGPSLSNSSLVDVELDFDRRLQEERIRATLLQLQPGYRAVLSWRYWDGQSLQDISLQTGRTVKSIERMLARARAQFAAYWNKGQHAKDG
jgi:RNA polymerase sigma-70 factor (ECF subfamily)